MGQEFRETQSRARAPRRGTMRDSRNSTWKTSVAFQYPQILFDVEKGIRNPEKHTRIDKKMQLIMAEFV